jgi:hypothetical protein
LENLSWSTAFFITSRARWSRRVATAPNGKGVRIRRKSMGIATPPLWSSGIEQVPPVDRAILAMVNMPTDQRAFIRTWLLLDRVEVVLQKVVRA